ncbi:fused MFS/spermidine synthase [Legionella adelaidensis]|uniref:fused MFS/spermidine synthase n=1 Tax=Legionella adelaidensis TaxID=45056 RepID=UPI00187D7C3B|nr:fused MFS/spermidine synthase [Legionella adelaidensis]
MRTSNNVCVFDNYFYRWLTLGSEAVQTLIRIQSPEKPQLEYIKPIASLINCNPGNVCLLGLGGGGIAHAISNSLKKFNYTITAIEKSMEVISIAKNFFFVDQLTNLNIINKDAFHFTQQTATKFEYCIVDLFEAKNFPLHCINEDFFLNCKKILAPNGILIVNLANAVEQWPIFKLIRHSFNLSILCMAIYKTSNILIFAMNNENPNGLLELMKRNALINKIVWDEKWGSIVT